jgi:hypothetical protein
MMSAAVVSLFRSSNAAAFSKGDKVRVTGPQTCPLAPASAPCAAHVRLRCEPRPPALALGVCPALPLLLLLCVLLTGLAFAVPPIHVCVPRMCLCRRRRTPM